MTLPHRVVILGGGTAGWMAANLFAKRWQDKQVDITLVESPDIGTVGVGEGSTPTLKRFFEQLDIPEREWMPRCDATYKVNIRFCGWSPASGIAEYSHPFISQVDTFTKRPFFVNCLTRRMGLDVNTRPGDFLLNGVLADQGLGPLTPDSFPFRIEYGYHFNSGLLGEFLASLAQDRGVNYQRHSVEGVTRKQNGDISSLVCKGGKEIPGDFFVDCSGFSSLIMQRTLDVPFQSYKECLFNDSAVVLPTPLNADPIPVETRATALSAGWCWKIPLTNRFGNGYVYSSDFLSKENAEKEFLQHLGLDEMEADCRHLSMRVGQLTKHWSHNCLALGLSQGFIEPLEATALHLVQISTELFISLYEAGQFSAQKRDEFNQKISHRFDAARDYIVAHYKMNTRDDSEYWRANRENKQVSDSLKMILKSWWNNEDLTQEISRQKLETHFDSWSWHCLLAGYGAFGPVAPNQPGQGDRYIDANVKEFLTGCALNFERHEQNLR